MPRCPKCNSTNVEKSVTADLIAPLIIDLFLNRKERFICKNCGHEFEAN